MNFGEALHNLKNGIKVARNGWNRKGMWLTEIEGGDHILVGDEYYQHSSYIALKTLENTLVPWAPSQTDISAGDWEIA